MSFYLVGKLYDGWFSYEKGMERAKNEGKNILTLQYESLKLVGVFKKQKYLICISIYKCYERILC